MYLDTERADNKLFNGSNVSLQNLKMQTLNSRDILGDLSAPPSRQNLDHPKQPREPHFNLCQPRLALSRLIMMIKCWRQDQRWWLLFMMMMMN